MAASSSNDPGDKLHLVRTTRCFNELLTFPWMEGHIVKGVEPGVYQQPCPYLEVNTTLLMLQFVSTIFSLTAPHKHTPRLYQGLLLPQDTIPIPAAD